MLDRFQTALAHAPLLRQSKHALADNIALNLAGAARDGVLARAEHSLDPYVGGVLAAVDRSPGAEQLTRERRNSDLQLAGEELRQRRFGNPLRCP